MTETTEMTWCDKQLKTQEDVKQHQQEGLILEACWAISKAMKRKGVSRDELAKRLGTTRGSVTRMLDGHNMTLRRLADIATALEVTIEIKFKLRCASIGSANGRTSPKN